MEFVRQPPNRNETNRIILHHTASHDVPAETIHQWHLERGFAGIGYHFVIRKDGNIEQGRHISKQGAHTKGANGDSVGIVLTGNFDIEKPTSEQINSLKKLIGRLKDKYGELEIGEHRDFNDSSCPGKNFNWQELEGESMEVVKGYVKGKQIDGYLIDGVTYAPVRELIKTLNFEVSWDEENREWEVE